MSKWVNTSPTGGVSILQNWKTKMNGNFIQLSKRTSPKHAKLDLNFVLILCSVPFTAAISANTLNVLLI